MERPSRSPFRWSSIRAVAPAVSGRVARRWLPFRVGRAESRRRRRPIAEGKLIRHRDRGEGGTRADGQDCRDADPAEEAPSLHGRGAEQPSGDPEAGEQARPERARAPTDRPPRPTAGGSGRRAARAGRTHRAIEGTRRRSEPSPSQTIAANAPCPCVAGGQASPARAIPIGRAAAIPTTRSTGPPGR